MCLHLFIDKLQSTIHCHDCLGLVLLQQYWADLLVYVRIVVEDVELLMIETLVSSRPLVFISYLLDGCVLLLLRFEFLASLYGCRELYPTMRLVSIGAIFRASYRLGSSGRHQKDPAASSARLPWLW